MVFSSGVVIVHDSEELDAYERRDWQMHWQFVVTEHLYLGRILQIFSECQIPKFCMHEYVFAHVFAHMSKKREKTNKKIHMSIFSQWFLCFQSQHVFTWLLFLKWSSRCKKCPEWFPLCLVHRRIIYCLTVSLMVDGLKEVTVITLSNF